MRTRDVLRFAFGAIVAHRLRSSLTALGIAVGVAAVVLLTSIGEGTQRVVLSEFTRFGTHLIEVQPGRTATHGIPGAFLGTVRPLTIEDGEALERLPHVVAVAAIVQGNAEIKTAGRKRRVNIFGVGPAAHQVWQGTLALGSYLPPDDPRAARALVVIGTKVHAELFANRNPLGERLHIAGDPYRVVGVMAPQGNFLGNDLDDGVYIPVGRALTMFRREGVMAIDVLFAAGADPDVVAAQIKRLVVQRHGQEDITVITQQQMLDVLGSILGVLTFAVGALGGISLLVGGVGILTIMTIAVNERTAEIGLLRALGAERAQVLLLFLLEAGALGLVGGLAGLAAGAAAGQIAIAAAPRVPLHLSWPFAGLAIGIALLVGLAAGVLPARRAARLDPLEALRAE